MCKTIQLTTIEKNDVKQLSIVLYHQYNKSNEIYNRFYFDVLKDFKEREKNQEIFKKAQIAFDLAQICFKYSQCQRRSKKLNNELISTLEIAKNNDVLIY